jgi:hypothetical protein
MFQQNQIDGHLTEQLLASLLQPGGIRIDASGMSRFHQFKRLQKIMAANRDLSQPDQIILGWVGVGRSATQYEEQRRDYTDYPPAPEAVYTYHRSTDLAAPKLWSIAEHFR